QEKWVVITNENDYPIFVLNADQFLRDAMYAKEVKSTYTYCHRPIIVTQQGTKLGEVILEFKVRPEHEDDDVVDNDIILYWNIEKRIITGADILGRLLRGIVKRGNVSNQG
ncbi:MAG: Mg2+ and Co2+ transporter CorB, partial [Candidatus Omnitrophica bacterium]|nr:Mg2+ and Co2+ transporter CorB [Candidatus Omnitrophota bacterium]